MGGKSSTNTDTQPADSNLYEKIHDIGNMNINRQQEIYQKPSNESPLKQQRTSETNNAHKSKPLTSSKINQS
jgi:hypothetical protein